MSYKFKKVVVIGLGGSIFYPDQLNVDFLKRFRNFLRPFFKNHRFVIVAGGGQLARIFMAGAEKAAGRIGDAEKDWLGIYATRLNSRLWQAIFGKDADPEMIVDQPAGEKVLRYPVTVSSGWSPGWSTDYVAAVLADHFRAGAVIAAGKPAYIYPVRKNKTLDEKNPFAMMTWPEYQKLIPKKWQPGGHSPVDPVAARFCGDRGLATIVVRGDDFANLENLLKGREFKGTIIK